MVRVVTLCYCTDWDGNKAEIFYEAALWKYRNLEYITNTYTGVVSVTSEELLTSYTIQYNTIQYTIMRNILTIIMAALALARAGRIGKW